MMPSSRGRLYRWMLLEKQWISHFCGISLQFRSKLVQMARTPFLEFMEKLFPATQSARSLVLPNYTPFLRESIDSIF